MPLRTQRNWRIAPQKLQSVSAIVKWVKATNLIQLKIRFWNAHGNEKANQRHMVDERTEARLLGKGEGWLIKPAGLWASFEREYANDLGGQLRSGNVHGKLSRIARIRRGGEGVV